MSTRALALAALLLAMPLAHAEDACVVQLGHGWPPATKTHGVAVEQLFADGAQPVLSATLLPTWGAESGVLLMRDDAGGSWRLRYAEADDRVLDWSGGSRHLRVEQTPDRNDAPIPAALAQRLAQLWTRTLAAVVPADRSARFHDDDVWLFTVAGQRVSGLAPGCGPSQQMMEQVEILIEAAGQDPEDRIELWQDLGRSLDEMERGLNQAG